MSDNPMEHVEYPAPVPEALIQRLIVQRVAMGWGFDDWDATRQERAVMRLRIMVRLRLWLTEGLKLERKIEPRDRRGRPTGERL